jgi:hypothetical protein
LGNATIGDMDFTLAFRIVIIIVVVVVTAYLLNQLLVKKFPRRYKPKGPYLLSPGENRFFVALSQVIPSDTYICPKVRIADLLDVRVEKGDPNFWQYLNAINQKHVDFVLCRKGDFAPLLVIELDGRSHQDRKRTERDRIVDAAFQDAQLPILHIPVTGFYEY